MQTAMGKVEILWSGKHTNVEKIVENPSVRLGKSGNTKWSDLWKKQTQLVRVQGDSLEESSLFFSTVLSTMC